jgi:glycosyltransferase involved in cell wall biosynthesis
MHRADGWIAFGHTVEETLAGRPGYRDRPHAVIPPGVDVARFRPDAEERRVQRELFRWEYGPPVIGYLGRFTPAKGLRVLMAALERTRNPWRALFVGGGEMEDELSAWAGRAPHPARVATGAPHDAVPGILAVMDILVAPSLTTPRWREQFGRMLIEAMACGVAVIASDSGEIPHVLGDAGAVVPEGDADALGVAIDRWLADPRARAEAARRGLERARTEFALPIVARRHLQFFEKLTQSRRDAEK